MFETWTNIIKKYSKITSECREGDYDSNAIDAPIKEDLQKYDIEDLSDRDLV